MPTSLYRRVKALSELPGGKYTVSSAEEHLEKNAGNEVDFLSAAVLVLDVGQPIAVPGVEIKEEELNVPHESIIKRRSTLTPQQLASSEFGGGGNVALPAAALGINTGVMGYVGKDNEGRHFVDEMQRRGISTLGIIKDTWYRTDVSIKIQIPGSEKREPLVFCESAGKYFDFENRLVKARLIELNPQLVQISYSGLFENGADRDNGKRMARGIEWIRETLDALVMVDTHTHKADPSRYDCLRPSLQETDMFVCSDDEVEIILPQYGIPLPSGDGKDEQRKAFLSFLKDKHCKGDRAKLYAVTSPGESVVLYCRPDGESGYFSVENWFATTKEAGPIFTLTGAGDSWRAGLNAYIINHQEEFRSGHMNISEAVQFANLTARLYISGSRTTAFKDYKYDDLLRLVSGPRPKEDLKPLAAVYEALDRAA